MEEQQIFNSRQAADYLFLSLAQLYKLTSSGKIRSSRPNSGRIYIYKKDLDDYIESGLRASSKEIQSKATRSLIKY
jgi:excisionase family DNA binding protein